MFLLNQTQPGPGDRNTGEIMDVLAHRSHANRNFQPAFFTSSHATSSGRMRLIGRIMNALGDIKQRLELARRFGDPRRIGVVPGRFGYG